MIAESSGSGGASNVSPADAAPSRNASCLASGDRVMTWTVAPSASATWAARWADAPNP